MIKYHKEGMSMTITYDELNVGDRFFYQGESWIKTDLENGDSKTRSAIAVNLKTGEAATIEGDEQVEKE